MAEHPGIASARLSRGNMAMGGLVDQMTDKRCESLSADLTADGAFAIPDQAIRHPGREWST
eukprot:962045-Pyramimonas_sp.AAC.1